MRDLVPFALPTVIMILSVLASVVYVLDGDLRHAIYWAAAATLTATITF